MSIWSLMRIKIVLLFSLVVGVRATPTAQDTVGLMHRRNTLKLEITQAFYPNSYVLAYERVTHPRQSFSILGGYEEFPDLVSVNSFIYVKQDLVKSGYKLGAEYRFYFKKENQYLAPHGVYTGPYMSYHDFFNQREIEVDVDGIKESATLETDFKILSLGLQLGYQFVINHRWIFDFVFVGPAVSNYSANMKIDGDFTFDKDEVENEVLLKLLDRFPLLDELLTELEISDQGKFSSWSLGWRYQFLVGFQFGRKRK